jgi:tetratricopeptide (TPR) repeat protein
MSDAPAAETPEDTLAALLAEQRQRWQQGERVPVEVLLQKLPDRAADAEAVLDLIYNEFLLREQHGEKPQVAEYVQRFPNLADQLQIQFAMDRLLAPPSEAQSTLPHPLAEDADSAPMERTAPAGLPDVPGYEVLEVLGRGGMGVVYKARHRALGRVVALKMILAGGHAGSDELTRFRREAEAVARLQHPNIVQIYEVGEVEGRPFLALEYVAGGSLAQHLGGKPQPARPAAQLVATLARTMGVVHQEGLVHRDLKPANVLLAGADRRTSSLACLAATQDKQGCLSYEPKITDFGLVKRLEGVTAATQSGAIVGTPQYMAPEQALGKAGDITPRTDVYGLGAILYEMLTGRPPFQGETHLDVLSQVLADEPLPPSRLQPKCPRDLETICLKCLHKEPARRYPAAAALADDLQRFLRGEPIHARPAGRLERLARWARREPRVAGLLAAFLLALIGGLLGVTVLWRLAVLRGGEIERQGTLLGQERDRAEQAVSEALEAGDQFFTRVSQERLLDEPGFQALRQDLLHGALDYHRRLVAAVGENPRVRRQLARSHFRIGLHSHALGLPDEALRSFQDARQLYEALLREQPSEPDLERELVLTLGNLANLSRGRQPADEVLRLQEDVVARLTELLRRNPDDLDLQGHLARACTNRAALQTDLGLLPEALRSHQQAFDIRAKLVGSRKVALEDVYDLSSSHDHLGELNEVLGNYRQAEHSYRSARDLRRLLLRQTPGRLEWQHGLAVSLHHFGHLQAELGRPAEARRQYEEARDLLRGLTEKNPKVTSYKVGLAGVLRDLARLEQGSERAAEALATLRQVHALLGPLQKESPESVECRSALAGCCLDEGILLRADKPHEALTCHEQACAHREWLVQNQRGYPERLADLGETLEEKAATLSRLGRRAEAIQALTEAVGVSRQAVEKAPQVVRWRKALERQQAAVEKLRKEAAGAPE